jgi:hypothetical protein
MGDGVVRNVGYFLPYALKRAQSTKFEADMSLAEYQPSQH